MKRTTSRMLLVARWNRRNFKERVDVRQKIAAEIRAHRQAGRKVKPSASVFPQWCYAEGGEA